MKRGRCTPIEEVHLPRFMFVHPFSLTSAHFSLDYPHSCG